MKAILEAARQKVGVDGWHGYLIENVIGGYIVTGSIAEPKKTGKNKGRLKWTKELEQKVIIADSEIASNRGTGRTTRMLMEAIKLLNEGKKFVVVFDTPGEANRYFRFFLGQLDRTPDPKSFCFLDKDQIKIYWANMEIVSPRPEKGTVLLVDHLVLESRIEKLMLSHQRECEKMKEMCHRFDE